jgi:hypothetical protein
MAVSEVSVEMWNGRDQFDPRNTGASDTLIFNSSSACWHVSVHKNSQSLVSKENNG